MNSISTLNKQSLYSIDPQLNPSASTASAQSGASLTTSPLTKPLIFESSSNSITPNTLRETVQYLIENAIKPLFQLLSSVIAALSSSSTGASMEGAPQQSTVPSSSPSSGVSGNQAAGEASTTGEIADTSEKNFPEVRTLLYKPFSDKDKNAVVLLPTALTQRAVKVEIISPNGKEVIHRSRYSGLFEGREVYRFSRSGDEFPQGSIIRVKLENGEERRVTLRDPEVRLETQPRKAGERARV